MLLNFDAIIPVPSRFVFTNLLATDVGWGGLLELETLILSFGKQYPPLMVLRQEQDVSLPRARLTLSQNIKQAHFDEISQSLTV
jgi:hypothetical protein